MAVDYEQWQKAPQPEKESRVLQARARLDDNLKLNAGSIPDLPGFFRDTYLLDKTGYFNYEAPELLDRIRRAAGDPRVIKGFLDNLRTQDTAASSFEVLASLHVARRVDYDQTANLKQVFDTLETKHVALLEQAERQRQAEEAEARRRARLEWPPELLTVNTGKSQEWVDTQQSVATRWEQIRRTLPQGVDRETPEAAVAYFKAGFGLLGEYILGAGTPSTDNSLYYRAALEYLIPQIWLQPKLVDSKLKKWAKGEDLESEDIGSRRPTNLKGLNVIAKTLFVTPSLRNLTTPPNEDQKRQVNSLYRAYQFALHPDVSNRSDINPALKPHTEAIHKAINEAWKPTLPLVRLARR